MLKFTQTLLLYALKVYCVGYHSVQCKYPLTSLARTFFLEKSVMASLCEKLNLDLEGDSVKFQRAKASSFEHDAVMCIFNFDNVSRSLDSIK